MRSTREKNRRASLISNGAILFPLLGPLFVCGTASAWENHCTHPKITDSAISMLNPSAANPPNNFFIELMQYQSQMDSGVFDEDEAGYGAAVVNHFYQPKTTYPLYDASDYDNQQMTAVSMFAVNQPQVTALARGDYWWYRAISEYRQGAKANAYVDLGHALHLLSQDMTQPAHTQNDPHIPQIGWAAWIQTHAPSHAYNGTDHSPLEASAETLCAATPAFPAGTGVPSDIPVTHSGKPQLDIAEAAARQSYTAATFTGDADFSFPLPTAGAAGHVFIGGFQVSVQASDATPGQLSRDCAGNPHYEIAPANPNDPLAPLSLPFLCYDPLLTYAGTFANDFSNDWWNIKSIGAAYDVWDPAIGQREFYTHYYNQVFYGGTQQTLNSRLLYAQLIAAQNYSAALLQLFAQTVDSTPPEITVNNVDVNGPVVSQQGYSRDSIFVTVTDPGSNPSGIGYLAVESLDTNGIVTSGANVLAPPTSGSLPSSVTHAFAGLAPDGLYQVHAVDGLGNHSYSTFTVTLVPPSIAVQDELGILPNGSSNAGIQFYVTATKAVAPVKTLLVFQNGSISPYPLSTLATHSDGSASFAEILPTNSWYWVQACDQALNCYGQLFGSFDPNTTPPSPPPQPDAPPGGVQKPNPPSVPPPAPQPLPGSPACLAAKGVPAASLAGCGPGAGGFVVSLPNSGYILPGDPNSLTGPQGPVTPGQLMTYTVEFENVGDGDALGVYVKDVLDPALDDSTLNLRSMYSLVFSSAVPISTTTANFPWSYDPHTRTVTVLTGNTGPSAGGSFVLEARLKSTSPPGTVVNNQALVYFPNAIQQITPTNTVVSAVPIQTQLASVGASSSVYLGTAGLAAQLSVGTAPVAAQPVQFQLANFSSTTLTGTLGQASASFYASTGAGSFNLGLNYSGDNFYYLPTAAASNFVIAPRSVRLQVPYAAARATEAAHVVLTLTDDLGRPLDSGGSTPIYLELLGANGAVVPLQSSLLSGTTASFAFSLPRPLQLSWTIRARFAGNAHYAAAVSTGALNLIDGVPPTISLTSPQGGATFKSNAQIAVAFSVQDNDDLSPSSTAYLLALDGSQTQVVANGASVAASSLSPGSWTVIVSALDWAGNVSSATSGPFLVTSDVLPPRTNLSVGAPSFGTAPIFVSSLTAIGLTAVDDRATVGDGLGSGVAQSFFAVDNGSWSVYAAPFYLTVPGAHSVSFYSVDLVGNAESPQSQSFFVDAAPPSTRFAVDGSTVSASSVVAISTDSFFFAAVDSGSGVTQTLYAVDGATTQSVALSPFTLAAGTHSIVFQSVDNVGNLESAQTVAVSILAVDTVPPSVAILQPAAGSTVTTATPALIAAYADIGRGVDPSSVRLSYDGHDFTSSAIVTASSASFVPSAALAQGTHTAVVQVADLAGSLSSATASFFVDSVAPVTILLLDGLPAGATVPVLVSTDSLGFSAFDGGAGVYQTLYSVDAATVATVYASTFSLAVGTHTLAYHSVDLVGNAEALRVVALSVRPYETTAPSLALVPAAGSTVATTTPVVAAVYADSITGVSLASLQLALDGVSVATRAVVTASSATFAPGIGLTQGTHTVTASIANNAGLIATAAAGFFVDSVPPATALQVDGLNNPATSFVVVSTDSLGFAASDAGSGVAQIVYSLDGATVPVVFVSTFSLSGGAHTVAYHSVDKAGNVEATKNAAITVLLYDIIPPTVYLQPVAGSTVTASTPVIIATYSDVGRGVDPASVKLFVDGLDVSTRASISASSASFAPASALSQSTHTVLVQLADLAGNRAGASSTFLVDSIPPVTTLLVDGTATNSSTLVLRSTDTVGFSATDSGTGVAQILYALDFGSQTVFVSTFSLAVGTHTLAYRGADNAGNLEALKTAAITVVTSTGVSYSVTAAFDPSTLNLNSQGNFVAVDLQVAGSRTAADINPASLSVVAIDGASLTSAIPSLSHPPAQLGYNGGLLQLQVDFGRQAMIAVLPVNEVAKVAISGRFQDGTPFVASGFIQTIKPGKAKQNQNSTIVNAATGAQVFLPAGALSQDTDISVVKVAAEPDGDKAVRDGAAQAQQLQRVGTPYQFGPDGSQFATPATLTVPYDPSALGGVDPKGLQIAYWNSATGNWESLASSVDVTQHQVIAQTPHFSVYQIVAQGNSAGTAGIRTAAADATFGLKAAYAFPNPVRSGAVTIRIQPGLADGVSVRVYDLGGRKVHESSNFSLNPAFDDGNGLGAQYTYDHSWDISGVGSGVYNYVITAVKAGQADIHKTGKIGVIK